MRDRPRVLYRVGLCEVMAILNMLMVKFMKIKIFLQHQREMKKEDGSGTKFRSWQVGSASCGIARVAYYST